MSEEVDSRMDVCLHCLMNEQNNDTNLLSPADVEKEGYVRVAEAECARDYRDENNQKILKNNLLMQENPLGYSTAERRDVGVLGTAIELAAGGRSIVLVGTQLIHRAMTDKEAKELKDLISKRSSIKGRLTTFEIFLKELIEFDHINKCQLNELKIRLRKLQELFNDCDLVQTSVDIKDLSAQSDREGTENISFKSTAEAREMIEKYDKCAYSESSVSSHCNNKFNVKLPTITLPSFDGEITKWLEFRDTYISMIYGNDSLPKIAKYQYLKGSLSGTAANVIDSLELTSKNCDIAWKLVMDRFNNKQQLVYTHLKSLFDVPAINKECADLYGT
ncbi:hypothetical protein EVAR_98743_1 [Eumeta japonica]|uniref:Uncharacterized protein n=1 Tax=Eumeta variegata TaxID=151549 RepID=A0A4C1YXB0_EUMVA|nr:hypothetical protein EVAR_98743_1 [Eumeta japonica]